MEPEIADLCTSCAQIFPLSEGFQRLRYHASMMLLKQSSQSCPMFEILLPSLAEGHQGFPGIDNESLDLIESVIFQTATLQTGPALAYTPLTVSYHMKQQETLKKTFSITTCESNSIHTNEPIWKTRTTSTEDRISKAQTWLQKCEMQHQQCRPSISQLPKRLIEVGSLDGKRSSRLILSEDLKVQTVRYATLSYRWGNANFCTTKANEDLHMKEIPSEQLPRTLRDAVKFTSRLNIQYLWIDALCIVQDDDAEWKIEASRMGSIYSGSTLTIAASDAEDGSLGLFCDAANGSHKSEQASSYLLSIGNKSKWKSRTLVRIQSGNALATTATSILNERGWVLQEMILSHRVLHFMRSEIFWECRVKRRVETGLVINQTGRSQYGALLPVLPLDHHVPMNSKKFWRNFKSNITSRLQPHRGLRAIEIWWKWVENYSRRQFTFPEDRIPALAGLIAQYEMITKDTPIKGLWERTLAQDLLWERGVEVDHRGSDGTMHRLADMPSWTWLSCPHNVTYVLWYFGPDNKKDQIDIVGWECTTTSSSLTVAGPVRELTLKVPPDQDQPQRPVQELGTDFAGSEFESRVHWQVEGQFDDERRTEPKDYLCLLLVKSENGREYTNEIFLILERCLHIDQYRRVGIGRCYDPKGEGCFDPNNRRRLVLV